MSGPKPRRRRASDARRTLGSGVIIIVLFVAAIAGIKASLARFDSNTPLKPKCYALLDGTQWTLSPEQAQNAALFSAMATERRLPARALTIAIATALQESKMINIDYGDRDSVGLFQQRPSQGWGSVEEIMDPVYSTGRFYDRLVRVPGYRKMSITEAAQAVQRSGFPDAYAQHETRARAWASALSGNTPAALTCTLAPTQTGDPGASQRFQARLNRDLPSLGARIRDESGQTMTISTRPIAAGGSKADKARAAHSVAQWAVAVADETSTLTVWVADLTWSRETGEWRAAEPGQTKGLRPGTVQVHVAGPQDQD